MFIKRTHSKNKIPQKFQLSNKTKEIHNNTKEIHNISNWKKKNFC